LSKY
jgi:ubiquitin-like 1-activating enzyme E1 A